MGITYTSDAGGTLWIGPPVGINESMVEESGIISFPNPGKDEYAIRSSSPINLISMSDVSGRIVLIRNFKQEKEVKLNTSELKEGIYLVKIRTELGEQTRK